MEREQKKGKMLLGRLFAFAGAYRYLTIAGMLLSAVSAVLTLLPVIFIWRGIVEIIGQYPAVFLTDSIQQNALAAVQSAVAAILIYTLALFCTHVAAFRIARTMRAEAVSHLMRLPLGYFSRHSSGKLRRIIGDSATATEGYLAHQLPDLVGAMVTPVAALVILFVFDWRLGLVSLIPMLLAFVSMLAMFGKDQPERMKQYQTALEDMNAEATEYVRGIPVVKAFHQSVFSFERFHAVILRYRDYVSSYAYRMRLPMTLFQSFLMGSPLVLVLSSLFLMGRVAEPMDFFLYVIFYILFTPVCSLMLNKIMWVSQQSALAADALDRVEALLSEAPLPQGDHPVTPRQHDIRVDDVSFAYPDAKKKAVDKVSLHIKEGSTVALVGPSGGGKSTLALLMARFWDVDAGTISIGGVDVREMSEEVLMRHISFVFQSTNLYKTSILQNVREGKPEATESEVMAALSAARCDEIIAKLPDGIHTVIGTQGVFLSGGEAQRIALARAILKDAPIILLDEATAFADPENEHEIQLAFEKLTAGKTVLLIAHRLSTVRNADCIYVMAEGRVQEFGTHSTLLEQAGLYATMWAEYNMAFQWNRGEGAVS